MLLQNNLSQRINYLNKGQLISKGVFGNYPRILPKNKRTNSFIVLVRQKKRIRSFVFWKNRQLEKTISTQGILKKQYKRFLRIPWFRLCLNFNRDLEAKWKPRLEKLDGRRVLSRFLKNFAAICFSDNIPTGKDAPNNIIIFLCIFPVWILSQKQTAVEFFAFKKQ